MFEYGKLDIRDVNSISLVNLFELSSSFVDSLNDYGIRTIAVTPSQIGLNANNSFMCANESIFEGINSYGINISSIQGILFGIDYSPEYFQNISKRLSFLDDFAYRFKIPYLILGNASLREHNSIWIETLHWVKKLQNNMNTEILIENICPSFCENTDPFYFNECGLNVCYDVSNYFSCNFHSNIPVKFQSINKFLHLSSYNHKSPNSAAELKLICDSLNTVKSTANFVWELNDLIRNEDLCVDQLLKLRKFLKSINSFNSKDM